MDNTTTILSGPIDCACVIHGDAYDWQYVERLYNMLSRHITPGIRLHVYTEADRAVPEPMIKHALTDWGIVGPKKSWWYKIQLFNPEHHRGPLLYFDLDTVIVDNIDWIWQQPLTYFWAIRDFKYLWKPHSTVLNSSVMWWNTEQYANVWDSFIQQTLTQHMQKYRGDQDYISDAILENQRRFFDGNRVISWRWQCLDGGYDFQKQRHISPGTGAHVTENTSILIFHGNPKPSNTQDPIILQHWQ